MLRFVVPAAGAIPLTRASEAVGATCCAYLGKGGRLLTPDPVDGARVVIRPGRGGGGNGFNTLHLIYYLIDHEPVNGRRIRAAGRCDYKRSTSRDRSRRRFQVANGSARCVSRKENERVHCHGSSRYRNGSRY